MRCSSSFARRPEKTGRKRSQSRSADCWAFRARYELAVSPEGNGVISPSLIADRNTSFLLPGNELLAMSPTYASVAKTYQNSQHMVDLVLNTLGQPDVEIPHADEYPSGVVTGADLFVGYLMLDALIGNTDRHHENWAMIVTASLNEQDGRVIQRRFVAPTHDHASSFGCHIRDEERLKRLATKDKNYAVSAFANKARSALYAREADAKPLSTVDAFLTAGQRCPAARAGWLDRLAEIPLTRMVELFDHLPDDRATEAACRFAQAILTWNYARLLNERKP